MFALGFIGSNLTEVLENQGFEFEEKYKIVVPVYIFRTFMDVVLRNIIKNNTL